MSANALAADMVVSVNERPQSTLKEHIHFIPRLASNQRNFIDRLPQELLSIIFRLLVAPYNRGFALSHNKFYEWTTVTQVSRQWRQTALNDSALWTNIRLTEGLDGIAERFLERSGTRLMSAAVVLDEVPTLMELVERLSAIWKHLVRISWRVQDLMLALYTDDEQAYLSDDQKSLLGRAGHADFRQLRTLDLSSFMLESVNACYVELIPATQEFPSLVDLSLQDVEFDDFEICLLPSLRSLYISSDLEFYAESIRVGIDPDLFYGALSGLHKLEKLHLDNILIDHLPSSESSITAVLPALHHFQMTLYKGMPQFVEILNHLSFSPRHLSFHSTESSRNRLDLVEERLHLDNLFTKLNSVIGDALVPPIRLLKVIMHHFHDNDAGDYDLVEIQGWSKNFGAYPELASGDFVTLNLSFWSDSSSHLKHVLGRLPLPEAERLVLEFPDHLALGLPCQCITEATWLTAGASLSHITELELVGQFPHNLLHCLDPALHSRPLFPQLQRLVLHGVDFAAQGRAAIHEAHWFSLFKEVLRNRADANMRLHALTIIDADHRIVNHEYP